jgi:GNAT superfamily N-acetyltransferase
MTRMDRMYAPLILRCRDDETGELLGASLTCRAQVAAISLMAGGDPLGFGAVLDAHSELDLMAVRPDARGDGIGARLIEQMEQRLRARGVRVWFGNVTPNLNVEALTRFYARNGFNVCELGAPLPPLLGREWEPPNTAPPAFYFWRKL